MKKTALIILPVLLLGIMIMVIALTSAEKTEQPLNFSVENWNEYPNKRFMMIEDFEKKYSVSDISEENIVDILGEKGLSKSDNLYSYYIGDKNLGGNYFAIVFDDKGSCTERYIYVD